MGNKMLDNILVIKISKVYENVEKVIVDRALPKYFAAKKWRWNVKNNVPEKQADTMQIIELGDEENDDV